LAPASTKVLQMLENKCLRFTIYIFESEIKRFTLKKSAWGIGFWFPS